MPSSGESESDQQPKKKRTCNPLNYKRNIIRNANVQGTEHVNWQGKEVGSRKKNGQGLQVGYLLDTLKCKNLCFSTSDEEDLECGVNSMNNFSTKNEQDKYLQQHNEISNVKHRNEYGTSRQSSFKYFVAIPTGAKVKVHKKTLISIYRITEGRVRRLCDLLIQGGTPRDRRRVHPKANTKLLKLAAKFMNIFSRAPQN
ncbi:hypothetical protein ILUMI_14756 [Ignelater luminosus]|uniref:Uncharacterized protein n=1 Tax=Ignelater luminosus TaxID=2038154 RepID=A0A8K0G7H2_IGNLU|nr:hypothetical protein ILUMI_14756 [Ignelater luminosus]